MNTYILYHNDADGFCAAWVFYKVIPDAIFFPVQYGEDPPEQLLKVGECSNLYIIDFSYPKKVLQELATYSPLTVLDHHKSAEEALRDLPFCHFDMNRAGCMMAYDYWVERGVKSAVNYDIVKYIQDHDLWRFELPSSKEVRAALASYPFNFAIWDTFEVQNLIAEGKSILRFQERMIERHIKHATETNFHGHKVLMTNCTESSIISEVAGRLAMDREFGVTFFDTQDERIYSLRSRSNFDVSAFAKQFGGGGHAKAAGFKITL